MVYGGWWWVVYGVWCVMGGGVWWVVVGGVWVGGDTGGHMVCMCCECACMRGCVDTGVCLHSV